MELPSHSNSMFYFLRKGDLTLGPALPYNPGGWPPSAKPASQGLELWSPRTSLPRAISSWRYSPLTMLPPQVAHTVLQFLAQG